MYPKRSLGKVNWQKASTAAEHGQVIRWMQQLGYSTEIRTKKPNIVSNSYLMAQRKLKPNKGLKPNGVGTKLQGQINSGRVKMPHNPLLFMDVLVILNEGFCAKFSFANGLK